MLADFGEFLLDDVDDAKPGGQDLKILFDLFADLAQFIADFISAQGREPSKA